ncbi:4a-hydroxytetrahydrobiopterin dehydratase [Duganella sp. Dugasp56]|jgi:4a-hydroxytetrahydrobiopterin dehydratase|uniref:4a-hydroxytetrahydrobiopterin dehydratase n=1 Tax=Duganella sp. Dugasp56 TaxID=3243046 RepID=UPI00159E0135
MSTPIATAADLLNRNCRPARDALDAAEAARLLALVPGWSLEDGKLVRTFGFNNYYRTMAFVNALAYLSHAEDHHPEMTVTYKTCVVRYDTHSVNNGQGGLSDNDFICAAKAGVLFHSAAVKA